MIRSLSAAALAGLLLASPSNATDLREEATSGALDGLVFVATLEVEGYDAPFDDRISFKDGMFYSEECQHACDFGWTSYYTRETPEGIAFTAEYICPTSPQTVRWRGVVSDGEISGTGKWIVERFYWTVERNAVFSGNLESSDTEQAALTPE